MPKRKGSKGGGRPPGEYSQLSEEEKRAYHTKATQAFRGKPQETEASAVDSSEDEPPCTEPKSRGRPPLKDSAMTPRTLRRRKKDLTASKRHQRSVSKVREKAAKVRWQIESGTSVAGTMEPEGCSTDACEGLSSNKDVITKTVTQRQLNRIKCRLVGLIPSYPLDNLDVFFQYLPYSQVPEADLPAAKYKFSGNLSARQRRYRAKAVNSLFMNYSVDTQRSLLKYWINRLVSDSLIENILDKCEILFPPELVPKYFNVSRISSKLSGTFLSRCRSTDEQKKQGTLYVISVAKEAGLVTGNHGDIQTLATATSCSRRFAKSVLQAISEGTEEELLKRNIRCDSIKATEWPSKIVEYVFQPENTRAMPGQDTVSVRYGVRRPKYLLLKARRQIAESFKEQNPECPFSVSTIMREFPQNAVTPTSRDLERNTCPVHANARRMIRALHKAGVAKDISTSCRMMASESMCQTDRRDPADPLTWDEDCVFGNCSRCQNLNIHIPQNVQKKEVSFSLWTYQMSTEKAKNVFGLFQQKMSIEDAVAKFIGMLPKLRQHIYIAHHQWKAHAAARSQLDISSIITIEDYQQNLEVVYSEAPTSMAYSTNKLTTAVYPICIEYVDSNSDLQKGAIVFISEDKKHDFIQVEAFEKRMFQILDTKGVGPVKYWQRYSDACAAQFRSRKVNGKLLSARKEFNLSEVSFEYFEANEGKNISDSIGSIVKCAFQRGITKLNEGVTTAAEIVKVICSEVKETTAKFSFFVIEEFPTVDRTNVSPEYPLPGILTVHSLRLHKDGLLARKLSCTACSPKGLCQTCKDEPASVSVDEPETAEDDIPPVQDSDDEGASDISSSSDDDSSEESISPGDIVWAKYGRVWYPAKIVSSCDVPIRLQRNLFRCKGDDSVVVLWYGEDRFSRVKCVNIDVLAENKIDASRAAKNDTIHLAYQLALADLRQD